MTMSAKRILVYPCAVSRTLWGLGVCAGMVGESQRWMMTAWKKLGEFIRRAEIKNRSIDFKSKIRFSVI